MQDFDSQDGYFVDDDGEEYESHEDFLDVQHEREQRAIEMGSWECHCGVLHPPPSCR